MPLGTAPDDHAVIKKSRGAVDARYPDRMLLAEANLSPEETSQYFRQGDEHLMVFHFPLMPRIYMALAEEDRHPITDIMRRTASAVPDPAKGRYGPLDVNHGPDTEMAS